jgi:uncharacterized delta-60 repeat protein
MRTLLSTSLALVVSAACTSDSPSPSDPIDPPMMDEPETPAVELALGTGSARVIRGRTIAVAVTVTRMGGAGDVTVTADDLPPGVMAATLTIAVGQSTGMLELTADGSMALGTYATATIRASAGEAEATSPLDMHLTDPPGALDVTYGIGGTRLHDHKAGSDELTQRIAFQQDGKLLVAGYDSVLEEFFLVRYDEHGDLDTTFGIGGVFRRPQPEYNTAVAGLGVRPDGTILLATSSFSETVVFGITPDGASLGDYGTAGTAVLSKATIGQDFAARVGAVAPDGTLVLGWTAVGGTSLDLVRLTPAGVPDPTFDGDGLVNVSYGAGTNTVHDIMFRPDGRIVLAGYGGAVYSSYAVAQLTADGMYDAGFSTDGKLIINVGVSSMVGGATLLPDGRIGLVGTRQTPFRREVTLIKSDGQLDYSFDGDGFATVGLYDVTAVAAVDDGIIAFGSLTMGGDAAAVKLRMDGSLDTTFGTAGSSVVNTTVGPEQVKAVLLDAQDRPTLATYSWNQFEYGQIGLARMW